MRVPKRISYSEDVDILMIQLSNKKIDDSYDTDDMIVQVDKDGEPVVIEIFNGSRYIKELGKSLPKRIKSEFLDQANVTVPHQIRK